MEEVGKELEFSGEQEVGIDMDMVEEAGFDMDVQVKQEEVDVLVGMEQDNRHWIFKREAMGLKKKPDYPSCCSYAPVTMDNPFKWEAAVIGPPYTPYEYGVFFLSIDLHPDHPRQPPAIKFLTKVPKLCT